MIHTIWLGTDIPVRYQQNINILRKLNPNYPHIHWQDRDLPKILKEYDIEEVHNSVNFISKFNLIKYTILDKYGGIYTDLDIKWKKSFDQIMYDHNFNTNNIDIILTHSAYSNFYIDDKHYNLLDDPFIISKKGIMKDCIEYRNKRTLRIDPDTNQVHKAEPIGPFLLSEWAYKNNIRMSVFNQDRYLDGNGYYGNHEQLGLWDTTIKNY